VIKRAVLQEAAEKGGAGGDFGGVDGRSGTVRLVKCPKAK